MSDFELPVNYHGATLPRGWQRTYPNLMTSEDIRSHGEPRTAPKSLS